MPICIYIFCFHTESVGDDSISEIIVSVIQTSLGRMKIDSWEVVNNGSLKHLNGGIVELQPEVVGIFSPLYIDKINKSDNPEHGLFVTATGGDSTLGVEGGVIRSWFVDADGELLSNGEVRVRSTPQKFPYMRAFGTKEVVSIEEFREINVAKSQRMNFLSVSKIGGISPIFSSELPLAQGRTVTSSAVGDFSKNYAIDGISRTRLIMARHFFGNVLMLSTWDLIRGSISSFDGRPHHGIRMIDDIIVSRLPVDSQFSVESMPKIDSRFNQIVTINKNIQEKIELNTVKNTIAGILELGDKIIGEKIIQHTSEKFSSKILLTPVITASSNLRVISWKIDTNGNIRRLHDATASRKVKKVSSDVVGRHLVTASQDMNNKLVLDLWNVTPEGKMSRISSISGDEAHLVDVIILRVTKSNNTMGDWGPDT